MKQTAVELLEETLKFTSKEVYADLYEAILQAKAIEKEQMKNAWLDGRNSHCSGQDIVKQIKNL
jgi:hypothetical protein